MARFVDADGMEWVFRIDVHLLPDLRDRVKIDMTRGTEGLAETMFADPVTAVNALWALCEQQAIAAGVTQEQFAFRLRGDAIDAACDALEEAVLDFRHRRQAKAFKDRLPAIREKLTKDIGRELDKLLATSSSSAGNSPVSAVSIPEG